MAAKKRKGSGGTNIHTRKQLEAMKTKTGQIVPVETRPEKKPPHLRKNYWPK